MHAFNARLELLCAGGNRGGSHKRESVETEEGSDN